MTIRSVAVIGSGVMGTGIAAHIANAGIPVVLLDIVPDGANDRNVLAKSAVAAALTTEPAPFMHKRNAKLIQCGNIEDDLESAGKCDWIIEAIVERLDIKQSLFKRLDAVRSPQTIISSNTSTIPLEHLTEGFSADFCKQFLITHFFNPPRYMRLLELVAGEHSDPGVRQRVDEFADKNLGKGVVDCHDTPGFIANRIGTYWIQRAIATAIEMQLSVEEVDTILSAPFGIPRTGVFGLVDLIGLDLMPHIMASMKDLLPADDPLIANADIPSVVSDLIASGYTGRKGKGGFYRMHRSDGARYKESVNLQTGEFAKSSRPKMEAVRAAGKAGLRGLLEHDSKPAEFAWQVMSDTICYAADLLPEIADRASDVDAAMRLGYSWQKGPYELLDDLGADWFAERLQQASRKVPALIRGAAGASIYATDAHAITELRLDGSRSKVAQAAGVLRLSDCKRRAEPVAHNHAASVWDIGDGVACLEFHTKMNAIEPGTMQMVHQCMQLVPQDFKGLVIHNDADNFSVGANIGLLLFAANMAAWEDINATVAQGQQTLRALKYAPFPVVGAPGGMALGGGCEILLHCDAVQAHAETYMGLVEVGVGLVPGWGGCKELLLRWLAYEKRAGGPMPAISKVFELVSTAQVAKSAEQARDMLFLLENDRISMNKDRVLADAKKFVLELADDYAPPSEPAPVHLPGATAKLAMSMAVDGFFKVGKATAHDCTVAAGLATVLSGGDTDIVDALSEQDLYDLEREVLVSLARHPQTLARVEHMLETGKPLRN